MALLLIDGYIVIHALPEYSRYLSGKISGARAHLARSLGRLAAAKKGNVEIHIFFDGRDEDSGWFDAEPLVAGVEIHFSPPRRTADEEILDFILTLENKSEATVVTEDRGLARQAGAEGAGTLTASGLAHRLSKVR
jgi:predicted RNA-binding protein with PIN domain